MVWLSFLCTLQALRQPPLTLKNKNNPVSGTCLLTEFAHADKLEHFPTRPRSTLTSVSLSVSLHCCLFLFPSVSDVSRLQPHCSRVHSCVCVLSLLSRILTSCKSDTTRFGDRQWRRIDGYREIERKNKQETWTGIETDQTLDGKNDRQRGRHVCQHTLNILSPVWIFTLFDHVRHSIWFLASCVHQNHVMLSTTHFSHKRTRKNTWIFGCMLISTVSISKN